ncbi:hypothetical protein V6N11_028761 [Hibiscus sabdariffa]|uniref:DUF4283 domain-containing protein n=1 Tax=Hibiscus sabdariffa TaxID=183260 RepID=A0ABR2PQR4_9ROSI
MGDSNENPIHDDILADDDIEILEGEVTRIVLDGLISIQLSECIQSFMDRTIILKLFGQRIGYATLNNKIHELWTLVHEIKLMDNENGYFQAIFQTHEYFLTVITDVPWTIFGHYLIVEPWSPIIASRFSRMPIRIDLNKPLISKLLVNGKLQVDEYESLPTICFQCGKYGHKPQANAIRQNDVVVGGSQFNPLYDDSKDTKVDGDVAKPFQANESAPLSPSTIHKGKQPTVAKQLRAVNVRKPLTTSIKDFPIVPQTTSEASSS